MTTAASPTEQDPEASPRETAVAALAQCADIWLVGDAPPEDRDQLLAALTRAGQFVRAVDHVHDAIATLCLHGGTLDPKATQEQMAAALGVSGPRVNAIVRSARRAVAIARRAKPKTA